MFAISTYNSQQIFYKVYFSGILRSFRVTWLKNPEKFVRIQGKFEKYVIIASERVTHN